MTGIQKPGKPTSWFSGSEIRALIITTLVMGIAFTIALYGDLNAYRFLFSPWFPVFVTIISAVVGLSLLLVETVRKQTVTAMEAYVTYEVWPSGVIMTLLTSFLGIVFAAAGRTRLHTSHQDRAGRWRVELSPRQIALMASTGPLVHLAVAIGGLLLAPLIPAHLGSQQLAIVTAKINSIIALSALVPVGWLDGQKIMRWGISLWAMMIALTALVMAMAYGLI